MSSDALCISCAGRGNFDPSGGEPKRRPGMTKFLKLIKSDKGATAIEYGLIAALIAVAAIAAMANIGSELGSTFNDVATKL